MQAFGGGYRFEPWYITTFYALLFVLTVYYILRLTKGIDPTNHWQHHFETLHFSSQQFYQTLEEAIYHKKLPDMRVSRIALAEGGIGSANREYLRIERKHLLFDVCAAPFGHGFFVSWWQGERRNFFRMVIAAIPLVGKHLDRAFFPTTYYALDTEEMFKISIHTMVLHIVDEITKDAGVRGLTELERKPFEAKR